MPGILRRPALFGAFYLALIAIHAPLLDLPFHWDELGQFVPQSLDLYRLGLWVPVNAQPNSHPPGLIAYLAAVWSVTHYSIVTTRVAMLAFGALFLTASYLLATACGLRRPWIVPALLAATPLVYLQSMLAQLDLPSAALTTLALAFFVAKRPLWWTALACTAAVLLKETSLTVPFALALWTLHHGRWSRPAWTQALWFALPVAALAFWFAYLNLKTGHFFGDPGYTQYNLLYTLHPVRLPLSLLRRFGALFLDQSQWLLTGLILYRRRHITWTRTDLLLAVILIIHTLGVSVVGGAILRRYILPALPIVAIYAARAIQTLQPQLRLTALATAALLANLFFYPPYPFSFEGTLALRDFVGLHEDAAEMLAQQAPNAVVATAWPLTDALRRPGLGYVRIPISTLKIDDFHRHTLQSLDSRSYDILAVYPLTYEGGDFNLTRLPLFRRLLVNHYDFEPLANPAEIEQKLHLELFADLQRGPLHLWLFRRPTHDVPVLE